MLNVPIPSKALLPALLVFVGLLTMSLVPAPPRAIVPPVRKSRSRSRSRSGSPKDAAPKDAA